MMPQRNKRKERSSPEPQTQPPSAEHDPNMPSSSSSSSAASYYLSPRDHVYPPGFKFSPTDEELVLYYLKPFSPGSISSWPVHHANIYKSNPQQLSVEYEKGNLKEWFFISERTNANKGGRYQKRGDNGGYWHATGAAKKLSAGQGVVGNKASLVYYTGKQPKGVKTNWLMKEYCLEPSSDDNKTVGHALCKIYQSPMAKKKKKQEVREVEQPRKVEYQQPQPELRAIPLDSHQPQPRRAPDLFELFMQIPDDVNGFFPEPFPLDDELINSHQIPNDVDGSFAGFTNPYPQDDAFSAGLINSQPNDIACRQPLPLDTVGYQQPQFWPAPLDSHQSQPHDIVYHQPQPFNTVEYQQPQFWPAPLDSHQSQPHHGIAYHQPHQPQPFNTVEYQ